jgi:hypothetical protein
MSSNRGWEPNDIDWRWSIDLPSAKEWLENLPSAYGKPAGVSVLDWLKIENQGSVGACAGFSSTTVGEIAYFVAKREVKQFSPMFAYIGTQKKIDGIYGDRGSTISGQVEFAQTYGYCFESTWPYPFKYESRIPKRCFEEAEELNWKIQTALRIETYEDVLKFLENGQGSIICGSSWFNDLDAGNYRVETINTRRGGGGHAYTLCEESDILDRHNNPYILMANSWSTRWGNQGYKLISSTAIDQILSHNYTVAIGMTDLSVPMSRERVRFSF